MKLREKLFYIIFALPACLFLSFPSILLAQTFVISEIDIVGNQRIETETIKSFISLPEGQNLEANEVNEAYQRV